MAICLWRANVQRSNKLNEKYPKLATVGCTSTQNKSYQIQGIKSLTEMFCVVKKQNRSLNLSFCTGFDNLNKVLFFDKIINMLLFQCSVLKKVAW